MPELKREFPVKRLSLFGSVARSEQTPDSDLDVLVEVDLRIGLRFVSLAERLEQILGCLVDLVSRRSISPEMWRQNEPDLIDA